MTAKEAVASGKTALGIEFGSTRIKAVLTDFDGNVLAKGFFDWENRLENGIWTYDLSDAEKGMRLCYSSLRQDVENKTGIVPKTFGAIGISGMMHGYLAFDARGGLLAPFQTWRNTNTPQAAEELTGLFDFHIPQRWSIAHLAQRILNGEKHVSEITSLFTLASYLHYRLTGEKVIGVGDASGMFPIDTRKIDYDEEKIALFEKWAKEKGQTISLRSLLPAVLTAGEPAGVLTEEGAKLLDESGNLVPGIPFCPPEGDAGTGMVATNAVSPGTGNLSAGTSIFAMVVTDHDLKKVHREIDVVTTPSGAPCWMVHAGNGSTDLNAWVGLFREFRDLAGVKTGNDDLFSLLCTHSLKGDTDCGGLIGYGYYSGEHFASLGEGRPLFTRTPNARFHLANFFRMHLYAALGAVKPGLDLLKSEEGLVIRRLTGHGGLFRTQGVMQRYLAAAANTPVTVMETASEGGAWGIALLAAYSIDGKKNGNLGEYLEKRIFSRQKGTTVDPDPDDVAGFEVFEKRYLNALAVERTAVETIDW